MPYDDTNRGVLFRNDRKKKNTDPDYTGTGDLDGEEFFINGWIKESKKDGRKFFSFSFKKKAPLGEESQVTEHDDSYEQDVPF